MRFTRRSLTLTGAAAAAVLATGGTALAAGAHADSSSIPFGETVDGTATYYDDAGYGACGSSIDASSQMLVAVSHTYWTASNPNADPLCSGVSVQLSYQGTTLTLPVVDKCPSCDAGHLDLSEPAFAALADTGEGVLSGVSWTFVETGDGASSLSAAGTAGTATSSDAAGTDAAGAGTATTDGASTGTTDGPAGTATVTAGERPGAVEGSGSLSSGAAAVSPRPVGTSRGRWQAHPASGR